MLPNNKSWRNLQKEYVLEFSDYGNWGKDLITSSPDNILACILFFEDILKNKNLEENDMENEFGLLLQTLEQRLSIATEPTLILISFFEDINILKFSRSSSKMHSIHLWLLKKIYRLCAKYKNLYFCNLDDEFSKIGKGNCIDKRNWYLARCHFSSKGLDVISKTIKRILHRYNLPPSKVLVLDCDNTIWGGVIGEDGIDKIILGEDGLGQVYYDFQKAAKKLSEHGVLLVLASKNNEEDVWNVFENHDSMILAKKDIITYRINWNEKSISLKEISNELNLGLDSFVFWDDSPIERNKIRIALPEVKTIEPPQEIFLWPSLLLNLDCFISFNDTLEDLNKKKQYEIRSKFVQDKKKNLDENAYLKSINMKPVIHFLNKSNINRAAQLCQKTNQFNLRTIRYSAHELIELDKSNENRIFLVDLEDKYGKHGLIALLILKEIDKDNIFIDTFLMSCRVLGRYLEAWILKKIISLSNKYKYKFIIGEYLETNKNKVASDFYKTYGFNSLDNKKLNNNIKKFAKNGMLFRISTSNIKIHNQDIYD